MSLLANCAYCNNMCVPPTGVRHGKKYFCSKECADNERAAREINEVELKQDGKEIDYE